MRIAQIDLTNGAAVEEIIKVYQAAFGGPPWNEGWKCIECSYAMPLHPTPSRCTNCGKEVREYWSHEAVLSDLQQGMARPNPQCLVATVQRKVVGFAWGYDISFMSPSAERPLEEKLDAPGLCQELSRYDASCLYFYLDDIAVHPEYQGDGIGKELVNRIIQGHRQVLLRTLKESHMFNLVTKIGGKPVLDISHGRIMMRILPPPDVPMRISSAVGGAASPRHPNDGSPASNPGWGRFKDGGA